MDPASHYLKVGAHLGRDPGPGFGTLEYLAIHADVAAAGLNPLLHFELHGRGEGRLVPASGNPLTGLPSAIAASTVPRRGWRMTRPEAERVLHATLAPWAETSEPRRLMRRFDTIAARRYAAAAAALYDADCAAVTASVIIPTYNRGAKLVAALNSVLDQSHRNLEVLLVDDGSTDDTRERLGRFAGDPRLRVVWNDHGGVSAARNTGLQNATGEYVFYLDSDNTWTPDHLMLMLAGLRTTGADCAHAASCLLTASGEPAGYRGEAFDWAACLARNYVDLNVFAHRRRLVGDLGGFDTDLRRVVDWDLILRYTKERAVAFLPFVGCLYHDDTRDPTRITNAEPRLYRKMVIEKNRRGLHSAAEALEILPLSFGIKIAAPPDQRQEWGDFHFADSLAEALTRLGHEARIDFKGEWTAPETRHDDVVLILRGQESYTPRPGQLTLTWVISHPDRVPYEEYAGCDRVLVASRSYAALLSMILERPVDALLQCTDPGRFHLPGDAPEPDATAPGLFVGNSRNEYRQMVRWSIGNEVEIDIHGARWEQFIPAERIAGAHIANTHLGEAYRGARFVLNDHWPSMKDFGIVSNRVFDVVASGGRLITDRIPAIEAMFGDAVETVDDEAGFLKAVSRPPPAAAHRRDAASYVAAQHSFDARAKSLVAAVRGTLTPACGGPSGERDFRSAVARRKVGLLLTRDGTGWSRSAYIRLIGPLTTDHAHATAGLDLVALDGVGDPRLEDCDICIVQGVAVPDPDAARRLIARLRSKGVPLYVDVDDAFCLRAECRIADRALRLLMEAARETWVSTAHLAELYAEAVAGTARVRRDNLDPRLWRDYRKTAATSFGDGLLRFVHMDGQSHRHDLELILPAFERLARDYSGQVGLTLIGARSALPEADWIEVLHPPHLPRGYPALTRHVTRALSFDVGLAPLVPSPLNAARSDLTFLHYSAMGLLSVVSEGRAYRDCIDAGRAVGCGPDEQAWYEALAKVVERREAFAAMRQRAAEHVWRARNVVADPEPLADLLTDRAAGPGHGGTPTGSRT